METGVAAKTEWSIHWWFVAAYTSAIAIITSYAAIKVQARASYASSKASQTPRTSSPTRVHITTTQKQRVE
eukprot:7734493-Lingulodinium_polyedra.AAC.1